MTQCIVLSGPSGVGKTSVVRQLISAYPQLYAQTISCTTRAKRDQEIEGVDYYFVSKSDFQKKIDQGAFLEHVSFSGHQYGTLKSEVERIGQLDKMALLVIDIQGKERIKSSLSQAVYIFIMPPSPEVLKDRLVKRASESEESLNQRLDRASEEIGHAKEYDYIIENDVLGQAVKDLHQLLTTLREKSDEKKTI